MDTMIFAVLFNNLTLFAEIYLLVMGIIYVVKKKRHKGVGASSLIFGAFGIGQILASWLFSPNTIDIAGLIIIILWLFLSVTVVVLGCIILPSNGNAVVEKEDIKENAKKMCSACNCEAEETNRVFANTTEKGKLKLGNRQWFDIYTTYKVTYKCPQCGKTWNETTKEKTGKKLKKYDKLTKTWVEYDDAIF